MKVGQAPRILFTFLTGLLMVAGSPANASNEDRLDAPLKQGVFLFAAPKLNDPHFLHSVVLLVTYDKEGALGVIINRPSDIPLDEALPKMEGIEELSQPLFSGGPVNRNFLLALFRSDKQPKGAQKVFSDVYFTGGREALRDALLNRGPDRAVRVYAGYAGWGPGQLDREVGRGDWIIMDADQETVFSEDPSEIWPALFGWEKDEIQIRGLKPDPSPHRNVTDRYQVTRPLPTSPRS